MKKSNTLLKNTYILLCVLSKSISIFRVQVQTYTKLVLPPPLALIPNYYLVFSPEKLSDDRLIQLRRDFICCDVRTPFVAFNFCCKLQCGRVKTTTAET